ncbi:MAG TPA: EamA family transporter [Stellaceae bacterium]|jgi:undecaprenyl phosphate-alpha-L-ara4N flippase subunit ArnE
MSGYAPLLGIAGMIGLTVGANLMLKLGAMAPPAERIVLGLFGWQSVLGLVLFGFGGLIYAFVLRALPLYVAQVLASLQYVAVILAAGLLLREAISPVSWLGIACVAIGILLVGTAARV